MKAPLTTASCSGRRRLTEREGRPAEYLMAALPSVLHKSATSPLLPLTLTLSGQEMHSSQSNLLMNAAGQFLMSCSSSADWSSVIGLFQSCRLVLGLRVSHKPQLRACSAAR